MRNIFKESPKTKKRGGGVNKFVNQEKKMKYNFMSQLN